MSRLNRWGRRLVQAALSVLMVILTAVAAGAETPDMGSAGAVAENARKAQESGEYRTYLFAGYAVIWTVIFAYAYSLHGRQKRLQEELEMLRQATKR